MHQNTTTQPENQIQAEEQKEESTKGDIEIDNTKEE